MEGIVPAVFATKQALEAAVEEIRALGIGDDAIGVAAPQPGRYRIYEESFGDELRAIGRGMAIGGAIGAVAGMALAVVAVPGGAVALAGWLLATWGGGGFGAVVGGSAGLAAQVRRDDGSWCTIPVGSTETLLVVRAGERSEDVIASAERHGARCVLETLQPAR